MFISQVSCFFFSAVGDTVAEDEVVLEIETDKVGIFTFAPCMLLYLFHLKPTHALFCKIHSHSHLKLQTVKNVCETHN